MKKTIITTIVSILLLSSTSFANKAYSKSESVVSTEEALSAEDINCLKNRVNEIYAMDKSEMSSSEKTALKSELKGIKEKVQKSSGYIYISAGGLLLIIILLLILL
jgi:hypothetical protein